jgi:hypothetical protein
LYPKKPALKIAGFFMLNAEAFSVKFNYLRAKCEYLTTSHDISAQTLHFFTSNFVHAAGKQQGQANESKSIVCQGKGSPAHQVLNWLYTSLAIGV